MESGRDEAMEELAPIAVMQRMVESKLFPGFLLTVQEGIQHGILLITFLLHKRNTFEVRKELLLHLASSL